MLTSSFPVSLRGRYVQNTASSIRRELSASIVTSCDMVCRYGSRTGINLKTTACNLETSSSYLDSDARIIRTIFILNLTT